MGLDDDWGITRVKEEVEKGEEVEEIEERKSKKKKRVKKKEWRELLGSNRIIRVGHIPMLLVLVYCSTYNYSTILLVYSVLVYSVLVYSVLVYTVA